MQLSLFGKGAWTRLFFVGLFLITVPLYVHTQVLLFTLMGEAHLHKRVSLNIRLLTSFNKDPHFEELRIVMIYRENKTVPFN